MKNYYGYYPYNNYNAPAIGLHLMGNNCCNMYPAGCMNNYHDYGHMGFGDFGPEPLVINISNAARINNTFRTALWTGNYFQVTLVSIDVGEDIGLEIHPNTDQFLRIEQGQAIVMMGDSQDFLDFQRWAYPGYAIIITAGKWHNVVNAGHVPLKLYSIYAPPQHPRGTVHVTRADAMAAE